MPDKFPQQTKRIGWILFLTGAVMGLSLVFVPLYYSDEIAQWDRISIEKRR